ncbi:MAG: glycosyltransferase family 2 protein [archaeon]
MKPKLSIVVPCYDEEKNIPLILDRFKSVIKTKDVELILVDNGSNDNTPQVLKKLLPKYKFARSVRVKKNIGYGWGIFSGLKSAKGEFLAWTHADMQTDPKDVITAFTFIKKQENPEMTYVKGRRRERPLFDGAFTLGMSIATTLLLGKFMSDINAQPNVFHREFFNLLRKKPPTDFSFDTYAYYLAKKNGYKVVKIPVYFKKRIHGESHWNVSFGAKWKFIKRTGKFIMMLRREYK